MRRRLEVEFVNASCAFVSGYGSRELLTSLRGRPAVWSPLSRGWVAQPSTARDLIAVAEARGYDVIVQGQTASLPITGTSVPVDDPGRGLW